MYRNRAAIVCRRIFWGVVGGFLALTRKCFEIDGILIPTVKEKETMRWKRRKWNQQHKGDCHYRSLIKKGDCTCLEWGKSARTSLKEIKGLSSPFLPLFIQWTSALAESTWLTALYLVVLGVFPAGCTAQTSTAPVSRLLSWREMWAMLLFPRCVPSWACLPTSAVEWAQTGGSANLGDWTKMRQLMLLVLKPSSPPFGGCCHPWGSDV